MGHLKWYLELSKCFEVTTESLHPLQHPPPAVGSALVWAEQGVKKAASQVQLPGTSQQGTVSLLQLHFFNGKMHQNPQISNQVLLNHYHTPVLGLTLTLMEYCLCAFSKSL